MTCLLMLELKHNRKNLFNPVPNCVEAILGFQLRDSCRKMEKLFRALRNYICSWRHPVKVKRKVLAEN